MTEASDHELIGNVARDLVSELVPQEMPLFRATSEVFFKDPKSALAPQKPGDDMLGFGLGTATTFLTPILLAVASEIVQLLMGILKETVRKESTEAIRAAVRGLFKRYRVEGDPQIDRLALSSDQLAKVHERAMEKARQLNVPEDQARLLADSLVGSLVVVG